jgi:heptosyltransferase-2
MKKVLIIKLGYSETFDSMLSLTTSLGDVLRTTVILHFFKGNHVSWLVDKKARPLLENNKYIDRIWTYNSDTRKQLKKEKFDIIVNLEKLPEICLLSDSLRAEKYFGFRFNSCNNGPPNCYSDSKRLIELVQDLNKKRKNKDSWQSILAEALGKKWNEQAYVLGYEPKSKVKYDIGFNWTVGNKWTNKAWPRIYWKSLENLIKNEYSISWQQGLNNLYEYIDWINSCRLIVTADTLGLHLGLALQKRIVALFGPTSSYEIYFYNCGSFLLPEAPYKCIPCLKPHCDKERQCMEYIAPEKVKERIKDEFKRNKIASKV